MQLDRAQLSRRVYCVMLVVANAASMTHAYTSSNLILKYSFQYFIDLHGGRLHPVGNVSNIGSLMYSSEMFDSQPPPPTYKCVFFKLRQHESLSLHWLVGRHRWSHQCKNNKKSLSHLATLKQNLAPKNLRGCPGPTFHLLWCQWSFGPIRCWKLSLDLLGLRLKDKWFYQVKCFLMAEGEAKWGSFTRSHMCIAPVIIANEAHL